MITKIKKKKNELKTVNKFPFLGNRCWIVGYMDAMNSDETHWDDS